MKLGFLLVGCGPGISGVSGNIIIRVGLGCLGFIWGVGINIGSSWLFKI